MQRFAVPSLAQQRHSQIVQCRGERGIDVQGRHSLQGSLIGVARFLQSTGEVGMGKRIVGRHLDRMPPERHVILPVAHLQPAGQEATGKQGDRQGGSHGPGHAPPCSQVPRAPNTGQEETDQRDVRITIGHGLHADLHQANHRHERPQVPKPTDRQVGSRPPQSQHQRCQGDHQGASGEGVPEHAVHGRIGIKSGQVSRPDRLDDVSGVAGHGVGQADRYRQIIDRCQRLPLGQ